MFNPLLPQERLNQIKHTCELAEYDRFLPRILPLLIILIRAASVINFPQQPQYFPDLR